MSLKKEAIQQTSKANFFIKKYKVWFVAQGFGIPH